MEKSESIKNIASAMLQFNVAVSTINKDANNPFFNSKYARLSNILDAIKEPLQIAGLTFTQHPEADDNLTTLLIHVESGEYFQSSYNMKPKKNDPQALGSAITYAKRYALGAILGLNIDEDDDGNGASKTPEKISDYIGQTTTPEQPIKVPPVPERWLNPATPEWIAAIDKLQRGERTIEELKNHYKMRPEVLTQVENAIK